LVNSTERGGSQRLYLGRLGQEAAVIFLTDLGALYTRVSRAHSSGEPFLPSDWVLILNSTLQNGTITKQYFLKRYVLKRYALKRYISKRYVTKGYVAKWYITEHYNVTKLYVVQNGTLLNGTVTKQYIY
jgi:hypothetical protein